MSLALIFRCSGCDAKADGTGLLQRHFRPLNHGGNIGSWLWDDPAKLAPDGWIAADPYTQTTYCPECWASIEGEKAA